MGDSKKGVRLIPREVEPSQQFDLFSELVTEKCDVLSNTFHLWNIIPRYIFTPQFQTELRDKQGKADPYTYSFEHHQSQKKYEITYAPVPIKQKGGKFLACFPGAAEELVEEALVRLLTLRNGGSVHDVARSETWVEFSLGSIKRELESCLLYTSPSPRDATLSRMPSSA